MNWNNIRKFLDSSTWVIFFGAIIFSFMTVVAQNAIPGDPLYGFKLGYEKVMLASSRALNKQVDLQIDFVARRFSETTKVLASKEGKESLNRLNAEVESTAYSITMIEDPDEKKAAAKKYIAQLNVVSSGLGQQRQNFVRNTPPQNNPSTGTGINPVNNANTNNYANPTNPPSNNNSSQIVNDIDNTQETIEDTINEMENIVQDQTYTPPPPVDTPIPTQVVYPTATPIPEPTAVPTVEPTVAPTEPPPPTATPTLTPQERFIQFCREHPQQCQGDDE